MQVDHGEIIWTYKALYYFSGIAAEPCNLC